MTGEGTIAGMQPTSTGGTLGLGADFRGDSFFGDLGLAPGSLKYVEAETWVGKGGDCGFKVVVRGKRHL